MSEQNKVSLDSRTNDTTGRVAVVACMLYYMRESMGTAKLLEAIAEALGLLVRDLRRDVLVGPAVAVHAELDSLRARVWSAAEAIGAAQARTEHGQHSAMAKSDDVPVRP